MKAPSLAAIVLALACGRACADLVLTVENKDLAVDPPKVETSQIDLATDKLATDGQTADGAKYTLIYRADKQLLWNLDHANKTYVELDQATMEKIGGQMDAAMQQMQERMAQLPEDQRKVVEQMMKDKLPGGTAVKKPAVEIQNSGAKQTVNGKSCTRWDVTVNGAKTSEVWVVEWQDAGFQKAAFAPFLSLAGFFKQLVDSNPMLAGAVAQEGVLFNGIDRLGGCPVLIRQFDAGKPVAEMLFKSAQEKSLDPATFEIPAGYTKQEMGH